MDETKSGRRRRYRNIALAATLAALATLFFAMSIVQWGGHAGAR